MMRGLTFFAVVAGFVAFLFYIVYEMEVRYAEKCIAAGGSPVIGKGVHMCLKRDIVVIPNE